MKSKLKIITLSVSSILFMLLFWKQNLGLNTIIFSIQVIGLSAFFNESSFKSKIVKLIISGIVISSLTIAYHASSLAIFVWTVSIILLPAYLHFPNAKSLLIGIPTSLINYLSLPNLLLEIKIKNTKYFNLKKVKTTVKIFIVPIIVLVVFVKIFQIANPVFDDISSEFINKIISWLETIFHNFSFAQILFFLWGLSIIAWFIYKGTINTLVRIEESKSDIITRKRKKHSNKQNYIQTRKGLKPSLKYEFKSGLILIILVNLLFLIINIIDISKLWIAADFGKDSQITELVHHGTYMLIFSILLSMAIMLYYFRKNQNFYYKKSILQNASYLWIIQNVILLISVIIRNIHYIYSMGLAYKRIGLFFFLALVVVGLITLIIKIKSCKSAFYLLKINSFALYIGFVFFAVPDWDTIIAKYNTTRVNQYNVDVMFLLELDEKTLPYIENNKEILKNSYYSVRIDDNYSYRQKNKSEFLIKRYNQKIEHFLSEYSKKSWLSWNYADAKAYKKLKSIYNN